MKLIVKFMMVIALILVVNNNSFALDLPICKITKIGHHPELLDESIGRSANVVFLEDLSTPAAWTGARMFELHTDISDAGVAALYTAYSLDKTVNVRITSATAGSLITVIIVN